MASIIIRYQSFSKMEVSPLAPHRVRFAPQNRLFESADCKDINIQKNLLNFIKNAYIFFVFSFP